MVVATKHVRLLPGVSVYTGLGHAPFGPEHVLALPEGHVSLLLDAALATPVDAAGKSLLEPPAAEEHAAEDHPAAHETV